MNWETAKNWLIVAFLLLDLLLGWQVYQERREMLSDAASEADLVVDTRTLLAERGFTLKADIPADRPNLASLHAEYVDIPLRDVARAVLPGHHSAALSSGRSTIETPVGTVQRLGPGTWRVTYHPPLSLQESSDRQAPPLWDEAEYTFDKWASTSVTLVYEQTYHHYPIFDVQADVETDGKSVFEVTQTALTQIHPIGDAKPVISAVDALDSLANVVDKSTIGADNTILKIDLGYVHKLSYWFPVWRIVTPARVYYINAFTGEVDTSS